MLFLAKWSLYLSIVLSPLYQIRFSVGFIATNVLDVLLGVSIVFHVVALLGSSESKQNARNIFRGHTLFWTGCLFLFVGLVTSFTITPTSVGLGILKSWFFLPFAAVVLHRVLFLGRTQELLKAVIAGTLATVFGGLVYFFSGTLTYDGRLSAFFLSPNHLAMAIAPGIVLVWFLWARNTQNYSSRRALAILASALCIFVLFQTRSAGAVAGVCVSTIAGEVLLAQAANKRKIVIAALFMILVMGIFAWVFRSNIESIFSLDNRTSLASRLMIWRSALHIARDHPIVGIGPGNFQSRYLEYQSFYSPYLEWAVPQPHNLFLAFWLQTGVAGVVGFFLMLLFILFRIREALLSRTYNEAQRTQIAALAAILCVLVHGLVDTPIWKNDLSLVWWCLMVCLVTANAKVEVI